MGEDLRPGSGGAFDRALEGMADLQYPRQRSKHMLARDAPGYLQEGEKLLDPAAFGTRGGRAMLLAGLGVMVLTVALPFVVTAAAAGVVFGVGAVLAMVLLAAAVLFFARTYAVVLTDRRLLVFRTDKFGGGVQGIFMAAPRSEVMTDYRRRLGIWSVLSVGYPPVTGNAPLPFDFLGWAPAARSIHLALTAPAGSPEVGTR
jgi:hypothetical protein